MKQILQNMRSGKIEVAEVPTPAVHPGSVIVQTAFSLVSAGTERMLVEFAEKNLVGKARSRPDLVRQMIDKAHREGIIPTLQAAFNRLDQPLALGYSSSGTIIEVGDGVNGFQPGERVACAGSGYAVHAQYVRVPVNLMTRLPENVSLEYGAFTTMGAIAMHGLRLAQPQFGEKIAVIGLGLLGLLAVELSRAAGCKVFGVDLDPKRVELACTLGAKAVLRENCIEQGEAFTGNLGFDIVLICADTSSDDPVNLAAQLARDRGRVVAIGAVGMNIPRKPYYEKELTFLVSRSYGPGRYDPVYEEKGQDYPPGYVRWTEGRNLQAFTDLLSENKLNIEPLITHRIPIEKAPEAYELITAKRRRPFLGVLLTYPQTSELPERKIYLVSNISNRSITGIPRLGVLGAGNYANAVFLPVVKRVGRVSMSAIASATGLSAQHAARRYGFNYSSAHEEDILSSQEIDIVAVLTRHQHHARQITKAFEQGISVYCEKPLAITEGQLDEISSSLAVSKSLLMVGFNRRFASLSIQLKDFCSDKSEPMAVHYRVNAGYLPANHWLHDPSQGGGRIIGEGCHFIDYLTYVVGALPERVIARSLPDDGKYHQDNVEMMISFVDGSLGTIHYLANGDKRVPKEYVEVFSGGRVACLHDFRRLELVKDGGYKKVTSHFSQDKGHQAAWNAFLDAVILAKPAPIPFNELWTVTQTTFSAMQSLKTGQEVIIPIPKVTNGNE
jgi:predicted dehydrogenase/threonine dehydrogenase-like Zn-dependent dehydrogenase